MMCVVCFVEREIITDKPAIWRLNFQQAKRLLEHSEVRKRKRVRDRDRDRDRERDRM